MPSVPAPAAPTRRRPLRSRALGASAALAAAAVAGCGGDDPFAPRARLEVDEARFVVYPLTGSAPLLPAGLNLLAGVAVRPFLGVAAGGAPQANFDLAFDRDATGRVVVYTPRWLLVPPLGVGRAGLQAVSGAFASVQSAPRGGFVFDSLLTVTPGQVVVVETTTQSCTAAQPLVAKLLVDSIVGAAIHLTVRINPNCGFRSFADGIPSS
jgi:hypothetical protein